MAHIKASSKVITSSPTGIVAAAYSDADVIGAVTTLSNAVLDNMGTGILHSLIATDKTNTKAALDVIIFSESPANSLGTDNNAYALNDADCAKVLGRVSIASGDWVSSSTNNAEATKGALGIVLQAKSRSTSLYYVLVARGAITLASATDIQLRFGILQD